MLQLTAPTGEARGGSGHRALPGQNGDGERMGRGHVPGPQNPPKPPQLQCPVQGEMSWSRAQPCSSLQCHPRWVRTFLGSPFTPKEGSPSVLPWEEWSKEAGWHRGSKSDVPWRLASLSGWPVSHGRAISHSVSTQKIPRDKQKNQSIPLKLVKKGKNTFFSPRAFPSEKGLSGAVTMGCRVEQSSRGLGQGLLRVSSLPWWGQCHPPAPVWLGCRRDTAGGGKGHCSHQVPVTSPGCGMCRKVGRSPGKSSKLRQGELRRARFGEGKCLVREVGEEGTLRGAEDGDRGRWLGESGFEKGYGSTGALGGVTGEERRGRLARVSCCGFYDFRQRCQIERGGKGVADSTTLGLRCPPLPLPKGVEGAAPTGRSAGRVLARPPWPGRGCVLLSAPQPPVSRWMGRNLLLGL